MTQKLCGRCRCCSFRKKHGGKYRLNVMIYCVRGRVVTYIYSNISMYYSHPIYHTHVNTADIQMLSMTDSLLSDKPHGKLRSFLFHATFYHFLLKIYIYNFYFLTLIIRTLISILYFIFFRADSLRRFCISICSIL